MVKERYVPDRGDVVWIDWEPARGHEQKGSRPVFVVSPKIYNAKVGLLLACPITSRSKDYPFEVPCELSKIKGVILTDHIRSIDWQARRARYVTAAPLSVIEAVGQRLLALIQ